MGQTARFAANHGLPGQIPGFVVSVSTVWNKHLRFFF